MSARYDEPALTPGQRRALGALLLSIGLHAAILGLLGAPGKPGKPQLSPPVQASLVWLPAKPAVARVPDVLAGGQAEPVLPDKTRSDPASDLPAHKPDLSQPAKPQVPAEAASPVPVVIPPSAATPVYFSARELDVLPHTLKAAIPEIPPLALQNHLTGWVVLDVRLRADGRVASVKVKESSPPGVFDEAARQVFLHSTFQPGQRGGEAVNTQMEVKMSFQ